MIRSLAEFLGSRQAALLALLLKCGGFALSDGLLDADHLFTRKSQRNTGRFTVTDDEGLAPSVEMVVIAEDGVTVSGTVTYIPSRSQELQILDFDLRLPGDR
ncbi:hypothetical protein [Stenotrophomonas sp. C1657]|uniref:hypothetical protein n=1 Tax=Stenotrophomonas sp. C1657 TaxID=3077844 RepID=UPI00359F6045